MSYSSAYEAYIAGRTYYVEQPTAGYLRLSGQDRVDFLQRQTTNDMRELNPDRSVVTVLTSPTARILDVYTLIAEPDAIGVIPPPGRAGESADYLRSRIFFMDDVAVEDVSESLGQVVIGGAEARNSLEMCGIQVSADATAGEVEMDGQNVRWTRDVRVPETGYRLLVAVKSVGWLTDKLDAAGAVCVPAETYEVMRVEAGQPAAGHELTEDFTPLEIGLGWTVSPSKGCYTGQEVLARQITYDKVTKQMVGLKLEQVVQEGTEVRSNGSRAGTVTSVADSPQFGPIALAVLRAAAIESGGDLTVPTGMGQTRAEIVKLPFGTSAADEKGASADGSDPSLGVGG